MGIEKIDLNELITLANNLGKHLYDTGITHNANEGFGLSELSLKCLIADFLYQKYQDSDIADYFSQAYNGEMRYISCTLCDKKMRLAEALSISCRLGDDDYMIDQLADWILVYRYDAWYCIGCYKRMQPQPRQPEPKIQQRAKQLAEGFVYFLSDGNGNIKIGKTVNLGSRIEGMLLPEQPVLLHSIHVKDYHKAEAIFHEYYKDFRKRGEWFTLGAKERADIQNGYYPDGIDELLVEVANES